MTGGENNTDREIRLRQLATKHGYRLIKNHNSGLFAIIELDPDPISPDQGNTHPCLSLDDVEGWLEMIRTKGNLD